MGIKQVLSDVKNFVIAQEFNLKNYLGKAVIVIKDNPIPVIGSIICVAVVALGLKCYQSLNFFRRSAGEELDLIPIKIDRVVELELPSKITLIADDHLQQMNEKLERDLKIIEHKFQQDLNAIAGKCEGFQIQEELAEKSEVENEFPPTDLPPELPLTIRLKEVYENFIGEKTDGTLDESWSDLESPPTDLPPELPLALRLKEAYENFIGEKTDGTLDESWSLTESD